MSQPEKPQENSERLIRGPLWIEIERDGKRVIVQGGVWVRSANEGEVHTKPSDAMQDGATCITAARAA